jgi:hypothetical protein
MPYTQPNYSEVKIFALVSDNGWIRAGGNTNAL